MDNRELPQRKGLELRGEKRPGGGVRQFKNYLLLFSTLILFFATAEFAVRIFVPAPLPWLWPQTIYEKSSSLGFRLKPNQSSYTADKLTYTNSIGLRGPERTWKKPPGVFRILVLGDSIAFGYGVRYEDTFAVRLEQILNQSDGPVQYEVIGAGVPSFNTIQEIKYFREEGIHLNPDMVILALYWNDIRDKSDVEVDSLGRLVDGNRDSGWFTHLLSTRRAYKVRNFLKRSRFAYLVIDRLRYLRFYFSGSSPQYSLLMSVLLGRFDARVENGWKNIENQLLEAAAVCASQNIQFLVAILPMLQQLEQNYPKAQYPSVIKAFCAKQQLHCIDLLPTFKAHYTTPHSLLIPNDADHPNERGHMLIAKRLSEVIVITGTP